MQTIRTVIAYLGSALFNRSLALHTVECLISMNWVAPHLRCIRPIEQDPDKSLARQFIWCPDAPPHGDPFRSSARFWVGIQNQPQGLDLSTGPNHPESFHQHLVVHVR